MTRLVVSLLETTRSDLDAAGRLYDLSIHVDKHRELLVRETVHRRVVNIPCGVTFRENAHASLSLSLSLDFVFNVGVKRRMSLEHRVIGFLSGSVRERARV